MTAEERLKELYKLQEPLESIFSKDAETIIRCDSNGGIFLAAEHIDLIAALIIERMETRNE